MIHKHPTLKKFEKKTEWITENPQNTMSLEDYEAWLRLANKAEIPQDVIRKRIEGWQRHTYDGSKRVVLDMFAKRMDEKSIPRGPIPLEGIEERSPNRFGEGR